MIKYFYASILFFVIQIPINAQCLNPNEGTCGLIEEGYRKIGKPCDKRHPDTFFKKKRKPDYKIPSIDKKTYLGKINRYEEALKNCTARDYPLSKMFTISIIIKQKCNELDVKLDTSALQYINETIRLYKIKKEEQDDDFDFFSELFNDYIILTEEDSKDTTTDITFNWLVNMKTELEKSPCIVTPQPLPPPPPKKCYELTTEPVEKKDSIAFETFIIKTINLYEQSKSDRDSSAILSLEKEYNKISAEDKTNFPIYNHFGRALLYEMITDMCSGNCSARVGSKVQESWFKTKMYLFNNDENIPELKRLKELTESTKIEFTDSWIQSRLKYNQFPWSSSWYACKDKRAINYDSITFPSGIGNPNVDCLCIFKGCTRNEKAENYIDPSTLPLNSLIIEESCKVKGCKDPDYYNSHPNDTLVIDCQECCKSEDYKYACKDTICYPDLANKDSLKIHSDSICFTLPKESNKCGCLDDCYSDYNQYKTEHKDTLCKGDMICACKKENYLKYDPNPLKTKHKQELCGEFIGVCADSCYTEYDSFTIQLAKKLNLPIDSLKHIPSLCKTLKSSCFCNDPCASNYQQKGNCQYGNKPGCRDRCASNYDASASCHNQGLCYYNLDSLVGLLEDKWRKYAEENIQNKKTRNAAKQLVFELYNSTGVRISITPEAASVFADGFIRGNFTLERLEEVTELLFDFLTKQIRVNAFENLKLHGVILGEADGHKINSLNYTGTQIQGLLFAHVLEQYHPNTVADLYNLDLSNKIVLSQLNTGENLTRNYPLGSGNLILALIRANNIKLLMLDLKPNNTFLDIAAIDNSRKDDKGTYRKVIYYINISDYLILMEALKQEKPKCESLETKCNCQNQ